MRATRSTTRVDETTGARALPGQLPRLDPAELSRAQAETLANPRLRYGLASRALFVLLDVLYGKSRTLKKFKVLELVARVPYQAWEQVAYTAITHMHQQPAMARRIHDRIAENRAQQDNELWHLLILEDLVARSGEPQSAFKFFWVPQSIAFVYHQLSWLLMVVHPVWSYRLNADFEDHAEHEYMTMVAEHPEWDTTPFDSGFADDYGTFDSLADLIRQIGHDERIHKQESIAKIPHPRFR
jgi:ubiquinol oxidase